MRKRRAEKLVQLHCTYKYTIYCTLYTYGIKIGPMRVVLYIHLHMLLHGLPSVLGRIYTRRKHNGINFLHFLSKPCQPMSDQFYLKR